jgi:uncharacterized protein YjbI with pentapeptide repeats
LTTGTTAHFIETFSNNSRLLHVHWRDFSGRLTPGAVLTQFRLAVFALALLAGVWAGGALAQRPGQQVARLEPAYGGVCEGCDLSGRILAGARMTGGEFRRARFRAAVMTRVAGADVDYEDSDFTDAILDHADFRRARFGRSRMSHARMFRTNFSAADLSRVVGLTQSQLTDACGSALTRLPPGLVIPRCTEPPRR